MNLIYGFTNHNVLYNAQILQFLRQTLTYLLINDEDDLWLYLTVRSDKDVLGRCTKRPIVFCVVCVCETDMTEDKKKKKTDEITYRSIGRCIVPCI